MGLLDQVAFRLQPWLPQRRAPYMNAATSVLSRVHPVSDRRHLSMPAISTKAVRRRILIVEDEAPIRELLRLHLSLAGFDIEEVGEGTAALERTRAEKFDVIVLDVMVPGPGRHHAVPGDSGSERERGDAASDADGPRQRSGQGARPRKRRRRLSHKAVRHPRDGGTRRRHPSAERADRHPPSAHRRAPYPSARRRAGPGAPRSHGARPARGSDETGIRSLLPARRLGRASCSAAQRCSPRCGATIPT